MGWASRVNSCDAEGVRTGEEVSVGRLVGRRSGGRRGRGTKVAKAAKARRRGGRRGRSRRDVAKEVVAQQVGRGLGGRSGRLGSCARAAPTKQTP